MGIPNEKRAASHLKAFTLFHLAALRADPAASHLVEPTERLLGDLTRAMALRESTADTELNSQALFQRKDFDLDELTRLVELAALASAGKDRASPGYRAAFPKGLSALLALRGKAQEAATLELTAALRARFPDIAELHGRRLDDLAKSAASAEDTWRSAERAMQTAFIEEQIARSELVRQLHSNRGALRALYPRKARRVASYFPPDYSRASSDADALELEETEPSAE